uniref:Uncharacterized protein n=1 Tax=Anopheles dirus TaxID=7168 RepID=A0A182NIJ0_9DIPT
MVLRMRMLLFASGLLLVGALLIAPAAGAALPAEPTAVEQLANVGSQGLLSVTTHIENAVGDRLDFNGDHFYGRDKEQHDFNRQAHQTLEYIRSQDPQLRRFLGKAIVKRQADFPYPPPVILVQSMAPYPVLKAKPGARAPPAHPAHRGSLKFKHSLKETQHDEKQLWTPNDDSVVVPSADRSQFVLCTVDCRTVEENVPPPETPAMTIPSDGRLW